VCELTATWFQELRDSLMTRLLTTPLENVDWSRYLREVSEKDKYNSAVVDKLSSELAAAQHQKDSEVSDSAPHP